MLQLLKLYFCHSARITLSFLIPQLFFSVFLSFIDIKYLHLTQSLGACLFSLFFLVKLLYFCVDVKY